MLSHAAFSGAARAATRSTTTIKSVSPNSASALLLASASTTARAFTATTAASQQYDVVIVGGGPGGYVAAIKSAQLGLSTACVEMRGTLGGTCLNVGCIPSKALLQSSHHYHDAKEHFADHGIVMGGEVSMDVAKMQKGKAATVSGLTGGIEHLFKKHGVTYLKGKGSLTGPNGVSVELSDGRTESLDTKNIVLATGSEVTPLPPVPVDNAAGKIVDSTGALEIASIPQTMAVVGGGVIGLEMGSVWSRLGTDVTVIEFMDRLCPSMDAEVTKKFQTILKKQGFKFQLKTKVMESRLEDDGVVLKTEASKGGKEKEAKYDVVLVATGRRPYTDGLGLEALGIQTDRLGRIEVDEHFRTAVPSIYAIGDCIDGPMLAHKAEEEGIAAVETIAGYAGHVNYDAIPGVIYTYPEVASVGKTEEELKEAGVEYNVGTFPFQANSRARANGSSEGFVKILSEKETDRMLGSHIIGPNAGEMIAEAVLAIEYGASSEDIARTCHAHPTLSEAFKEAAMDAYDKPIHF